jgi:hypothetical protein
MTFVLPAASEFDVFEWAQRESRERNPWKSNLESLRSWKITNTDHHSEAVRYEHMDKNEKQEEGAKMKAEKKALAEIK